MQAGSGLGPDSCPHDIASVLAGAPGLSLSAVVSQYGLGSRQPVLNTSSTIHKLFTQLLGASDSICKVEMIIELTSRVTLRLNVRSANNKKHK